MPKPPRKKTRYWLGKKQPPEMVERRVSKIRGSNHYLWKGGLSRRPYRKMKKKTACERCGDTFQLLIHHKNGDHYDNQLDNLEVLCNRCHSSLHKTGYWESVRNGDKPKPIMAFGENNGRAKITESDVVKIFELRRQGWLQREIAAAFGISQTHCGRILRGIKWSHLQEKLNA